MSSPLRRSGVGVAPFEETIMEGITVPLTIPGELLAEALAAHQRSAAAHPAPVAKRSLGPTNGKRPAPRFAAAALGQLWAMREAELEFAASVVLRRNQESPADYVARTGKPLEGTRDVYVQDRVAVIPIYGGLVKRHMDLFGDISGGSTLESLRQDFTVALNDDGVDAILLDVDSPGGAVNGTHELAETIYAARGQKPVVAYVGGLGASAAYWIASAADEIVADRIAILGSLGVMAVIHRAAEDQDTLYIVNSQSPNKVLDPETEDGRAQILEEIDATAAVFLATAARNRGLEVEALIEAGNHGGCVIGEVAVERKLADRLGSFDSTFADLAARRQAQRKARSTQATSGAPRPLAAAPASPQARPSGRPSILATAAAHERVDAAIRTALEREANLAFARKYFAGGTMDEDQDVTTAVEEEEVEETTPEIVPATTPTPASVEADALRIELATANRLLRESQATVNRLQGELEVERAAAVRKEVEHLVMGGDSGLRWFGDKDANLKMVLDMRAALGPDHPSFKAFVASKEREAAHLHGTVLGVETGTDLQPEAAGDAKVQLERIAAAIRQEEGEKFATYDQAMTEAMRRNGDLALQYRRDEAQRKREERAAGTRTTVRQRRAAKQ
jgi:ClpP class serine protease